MARQSPLSQAIAHIRTVDAQLKAFASLRDESSALALARDAGPLAGRLVAVKDIFDTADLPTCYGSPIYAGHQPASDAAIVGILRRGGALVIGKSVTT
jgi:Asp-tRNA(Asn)/Glu-tRNA(Gln) amidotransferase A subunit family amidase